MRLPISCVYIIPLGRLRRRRRGAAEEDRDGRRDRTEHGDAHHGAGGDPELRAGQRRRDPALPAAEYLEVWLQRVTKPLGIDVQHHSDEAICRLVDGENVTLWDSSWIGDPELLAELAASKIVISDAATAPELLMPEEIELFVKNALTY